MKYMLAGLIVLLWAITLFYSGFGLLAVTDYLDWRQFIAFWVFFASFLLILSSVATYGLRLMWVEL